jgi:hypothetical protein
VHSVSTRRAALASSTSACSHISSAAHAWFACTTTRYKVEPGRLSLKHSCLALM